MPSMNRHHSIADSTAAWLQCRSIMAGSAEANPNCRIRSAPDPNHRDRALEEEGLMADSNVPKLVNDPSDAQMDGRVVLNYLVALPLGASLPLHDGQFSESDGRAPSDH